MSKTFKEDLSNPALNFISEESINKVDGAKQEPEAERNNTQLIANGQRIEEPPAGFKLNPYYIETKSERIQILIQPSLKAKLKKQAKKEKRSLNDLIHNILEDGVKGD